MRISHYWRRILFIGQLSLLLLPLFLSASPLRAGGSDSVILANGTFIQQSLIRNWSDERWQQELKALKEVGMRYLVLAPTLNTDKGKMPEACYPSTLPGVKQGEARDLVEDCLRNAAKAGFKVFLGLNLDERWWTASFSPEWLYQQMETGNQVADELVKRYKQRYGDVLYGWYWVWEVDNLHGAAPGAPEVLTKALNINLDHLHALTPGMPVMLCPFMNYRVGTPADCKKMWTSVFAGTHFKAGDIFAPQDGVGAGGLDLNKLEEWYADLKEAVDTKPGLVFWSDAETFDQRFWSIATLDRFVQQMKLVRPYVSEVISFAYSHYYSPLKVNPAYHQAYLYYAHNGTLPHLPAPLAPVNLNCRTNEKGAAMLEWQESKLKEGLAGFYIYRNGQLVGNRQYNHQGKCVTAYAEKEALAAGSYRYEVCAYTCTGVMGPRAMVNWVQPFTGTKDSSTRQLPGLSNYLIPPGTRGAVIASPVGRTAHPSRFRLLTDTSGLFVIDRLQQLRLKNGVRLDSNQAGFRYGIRIAVDGDTAAVELVKDQFIENKVIAHRGAWKNQGASENSVGSLRNAIAMGCQGSEFDVWMSLDSVLVISHDPVIGGKNIESSTGAAVLQVALKNGEKVPSLDQYLEEIKQQNKTRLYLEIKSSLVSQERSLALTDRVVAMVRRHKAQAWVKYISFNFGVLEHIRQLDPVADVAYLSGDKTMEQLQDGGVNGADYPYYSFHSGDIVSQAHERGISTNAWTVDTKEEMLFLLGKGIDMITTNEPELLLQLINQGK
ncbi:hypothetical protein DCC81_07430 [Chitinophaga parva]|uniref:GP-PDE domain-containing protein n=1 Tax=Chitinophaga parva TaxID=2169414 RepID=A0A2T7BNN1_9BACT|nr:DUF4434 domain-containing protein [Chitinophaga parva]PUZ29283.1 hypothetical protein DCC81_07430 [Chitinophaga parva]